jgi:hypothetical protein
MPRGYCTSDGHLLPQCEAYRKGTLPFQARAALAARRTRALLIGHPEGLTSDEVRQHLDIPAARNTYLTWLQSKGMAEWRKADGGGARWFVRDMGKERGGP